jgi:hypothetical protein
MVTPTALVRPKRLDSQKFLGAIIIKIINKKD